MREKICNLLFLKKLVSSMPDYIEGGRQASEGGYDPPGR